MLQPLLTTLKLNPLARLIAIIMTVIILILLIGGGLWYLFKPTSAPVTPVDTDNLVTQLNGTNIQSLEFTQALDPELFYYNRINKDSWLLHIPAQSTNKTYIQPILSAIKAPESSSRGYYPVIYNLKNKSYTLAKDYLGTRIIGKTTIGTLYDKDRKNEQLVKLIDTGKNWIYSLTDGSVFYSEPDFKNAKLLIEQVYTEKDRYTINQLLNITSAEIVLLARKESIQTLVDEVSVNQSSSNSSSQSNDLQDPILYSNTIIKLPIDKTLDLSWQKGGAGLNSIWKTVELAGASSWQQQAKADYTALWEEFRFNAGINKLTPTASKSSTSSNSNNSSVAYVPAQAEEYHQDGYLRVDILASGRLFVHIAGAKNYFWLVDGNTGQNVNQALSTPQNWDHTMTSSCDIARSICKIVNLSDSTVYTLDGSGTGGEYTFGSGKLIVAGLDIKSMDYTTRYRTKTLREGLVNRGGEFGFWQLGVFLEVK